MQSDKQTAVPYSAISLMALLGALGVLLLASRYGFDLSDGGWSALAGLRVREGEVPHRDYFSLVGPVTAYLVAAIFSVADISLRTVAIAAAVTEWLALLLLWRLARRSGLGSWEQVALVGAFLLLSPTMGAGFFSVSYGIIGMLLCLGLASLVAADASVPRALAAGTLLGLLFLTKHPMIAFVGASIVGYWLREVWSGRLPARRAGMCFLALLGGSLFVVGLWAAYLVRHDALGAAYQNMFLAALEHYVPHVMNQPYHFATKRTGFMVIAKVLHEIATNSLWLVPPVAGLLALLACARDPGVAPRPVWLLGLMSVLSISLCWPSWSSFWIRLSCVFALVPLLWLIRSRPGVVSILAAGVLLYAVLFPMPMFVHRLAQPYRYEDHPRVRLYGSPEKLAQLAQIAAYLRAHPAESMATFPFYPGVTFVFNLGRASGLDSWFQANSTEPEAIGYMRPLHGRRMIAVVDDGPGTYFSARRRFSDMYPKVYHSLSAGGDGERVGIWNLYYLSGSGSERWDALAEGGHGARER